MRFSLSDRLLFEPPQEDPETTSEEKSKISEADDAKGEGAGEKSKANEVDKTGVTAVSSDASSEPITLSVGQAQELLIAKGFFAGVVDNILGKQTRKALSDFQKSLELPVSGKLDKATMSALLAEPSTNEPDEDAATAAKKPVLSPPILTVPDLELKSWKNSPHPQLNGNPLSLGKNDTSISYAFVPGGESFVLGTRFNFYHYDKNGKELWRKDAPGIVWALNVANNGKVLVAAFSDGTLRWYQLSNGQELLAFFPHSDARRWLAWTPNGIYAASVGADTLLGWHINNAPNEAANFYPLRSLRHHYYQPETLVKILERVNNEDTDSNVTKLLAAGDKQDASEPTLPTQFPPRIVFEDLPQNSVFSNPEVEIGYRLHFYNDMIPTTLHVMLNGRPLLTTQTEKASGSLNLQLPPRDVALAVIAENEHGVSAPEWLLLDWQGDTTEAEKPDLYILSIGISEYADENLGNLPLAGMDAQIFADKWQSQSNYYQDIQAKHLINSTYEEVREGLSWLRQAKAKDVVVVFWAGHSLQHLDNRQNTYFFLPADASLTSNTISSTILIDAFNNFPARVLMFIDTAYFSMLAKKDEKIAPADIDGFANELSSPEHGFIVFASTAGAQSSYIPEDAEHSVFTQVLLEALDGSADSNEDQQLTLQELETYVYARAHEITGGTQSPVLAMPETIRDFVLGLTP